MYIASKIKAALKGLVGWRPSTNPDLRLPESLTSSESGLYFNQEHPLLTLENLAAVMPQEKIRTNPWDSEAAYRSGDICSYDGRLYRAKVDNTSVRPDAGFSYWESFSAFSAWLEDRTEDGIIRAIQRFTTSKMANKTAKGLLDRLPLFDGVGSLSNLVDNSGLITGIAIESAKGEGVTLKVDRIGLQFKGIGAIKLYLMHSSSETPVKTIELQRVKDGGMEWFEMKDLYLPYMGSSTDAGGRWYLCYKQSELPQGVKAVNRAYNFDATCRVCGPNNLAKASNFFKAMPFRTEEIVYTEGQGDFNDDYNADFYSDGMRMWDIEDDEFVADNNYGLNLVVSAECDLTEFIISQKHLFQEAVSKQVAYDMLRTIAFNPNSRVNRNEATFSKNEILYELDGDSGSSKNTGLGYELKKVFESIELDITHFDKICLPCSRKGVKYKSIG